MKLLSKAHLAVTLAASTDPGCKILQSVLIEQTENGLKATATNKQWLAQVLSKPGEVSPEDFPMVPGIKNAPNDSQRAVVPVKPFAGIKIPSSEKLLPICRRALVAIGPEVTTFATTDLQSANVQPIWNIEGEYPHYENCIPKGAPMFKIKVGVGILKDAFTMFAKAEVEEVDIELFGEMAPIKMTGQNHEVDVKAIVMPRKPE